MLALDDEKAPATVANFVRYAQDGHYDGTIFHRVIDGFMIQGGGFTKDMRQKPTREPVPGHPSGRCSGSSGGSRLRYKPTGR